MRRASWTVVASAAFSALAIHPIAQAAPIVPAAPERECVGTAESELSCAAPNVPPKPAPRPPAPPQPAPQSLVPQQRPSAPSANPPAAALIPPAPGAGRGAAIVPVG